MKKLALLLGLLCLLFSQHSIADSLFPGTSPLGGRISERGNPSVFIEIHCLVTGTFETCPVKILRPSRGSDVILKNMSGKKLKRAMKKFRSHNLRAELLNAGSILTRKTIELGRTKSETWYLATAFSFLIDIAKLPFVELFYAGKALAEIRRNIIINKGIRHLISSDKKAQDPYTLKKKDFDYFHALLVTVGEGDQNLN